MKTTPFKSLFLVRFVLVWHNLHDLHNLGLYEGFHFMKRVRGCPGKGYSKILNRGALLMTYPCQGRVLGKDRVFPLVFHKACTDNEGSSLIMMVILIRTPVTSRST